MKRVFIVGPTASGKSSLAESLAASFNVPIISADSRQVYEKMDIGTAKPEPKRLSSIQYFNVSLLQPDEEDSTELFSKRVNKWTMGTDAPFYFFVGGSTRYLESLLFDNKRPIPGKNEFLRSFFEQKHWSDQELIRWLSLVDPIYQTQHMDGFNPQRTLRALEVWMSEKQPFSSYHHSRRKFPYDTLVIGLEMPRPALYQRIELRVDEMIKRGLLEEVEFLLSRGYSFEDPGMKTIGYREFQPYFDKTSSLADVVSRIKINTRRYAKRQLTFFRRWDFIEWVDVTALDNNQLKSHIAQKITNFLSQ